MYEWIHNCVCRWRTLSGSDKYTVAGLNLFVQIFRKNFIRNGKFLNKLIAWVASSRTFKIVFLQTNFKSAILLLSSSSLCYRLSSMPTCTRKKILLEIFLSNNLSAATSNVNSVHASAFYKSTGSKSQFRRTKEVCAA